MKVYIKTLKTITEDWQHKKKKQWNLFLNW